jgi:hypothetical protein
MEYDETPEREAEMALTPVWLKPAPVTQRHFDAALEMTDVASGVAYPIESPLRYTRIMRRAEVLAKYFPAIQSEEPK